jgi:hypothetical protein
LKTKYKTYYDVIIVGLHSRRYDQLVWTFIFIPH